MRKYEQNAPATEIISTRVKDQVRYVFRTPLWRKLLPLFLAGVVWIVPLVLDYISRIPAGHPAVAVIKSGVVWLADHGILQHRTVIVAWVWLALMLVWFWRELATLTVTPVSIIRKMPLLPARELKWNDADEILIEHVERIWEGKATAMRELKVYAVRRFFDLRRRRMRITNRQFEGFHQVERLAVQISVPAICRRKMAEMDRRRRPLFFSQREPGTNLRLVLYLAAIVALVMAFLLDKLWLSPTFEPYRLWTLYAAVFFGLLFVRKLFYYQVGIDRHNVYVMLNSMVLRKAPIEAISGMRSNGNKLGIEARIGRDGAEKTFFSTRRFIRNRGVLLHLIREIRDQRKRTDEKPITLVRTDIPVPVPVPAPAETMEAAVEIPETLAETPEPVEES
ncbi:hypothetical protein CVU37_11280 [candidate division BRC1 bacterium HGW-BRC1-1]|nr:MAG: hypothetical protein CVU37_11280 [candidate division BRC1 bacterium HGW-BRC1-1]